MTRLKVKDEPSLVRDSISNGIINTDDVAYHEYLKRKRLSQRLEEERSNSEARLNNIEQDVVALKQGIREILELLKK